jgi:multiple sugar transport system substrate-binding protein
VKQRCTHERGYPADAATYSGRERRGDATGAGGGVADPTTLTGITWNHTRGWLPLAAAAQRFMDARPDVRITWEKRSLQEFADYPIQRLAERFDLIVIDHPFAGYAAAHPTLLPLDEFLPADYLADQRANSVGASYRSYEAGGHLWALPIDAAAPVASWRGDVLARHDAGVPQTWADLLALARRGLVALPAIPVDALMATYALCIALGGREPFADGERMADEAVAAAALESLRELVSLAGPATLDRNPIRTYEAMVASDDLGYCPFAYGYSNYARAAYVHPRPTLRFGGLVEVNGRRLRSTLGGTGLAITRRCRGAARDLALEYAAWVCSPTIQRGMYVGDGGQPGHRAAWEDDAANALCGNFFRDTLQTLDEAYLRPRHDGAIPFQDEAGLLVHAFLRDGGDPRAVARAIDHRYRESLPRA